MDKKMDLIASAGTTGRHYLRLSTQQFEKTGTAADEFRAAKSFRNLKIEAFTSVRTEDGLTMACITMSGTDPVELQRFEKEHRLTVEALDTRGDLSASRDTKMVGPSSELQVMLRIPDARGSVDLVSMVLDIQGYCHKAPMSLARYHVEGGCAVLRMTLTTHTPGQIRRAAYFAEDVADLCRDAGVASPYFKVGGECITDFDVDGEEDSVTAEYMLEMLGYEMAVEREATEAAERLKVMSAT